MNSGNIKFLIVEKSKDGRNYILFYVLFSLNYLSITIEKPSVLIFLEYSENKL